MIFDIAVIFVYSAAVIAVGYFAGKKESSAEDFFLAGRTMKWWAVTISVYATALSAMTFIGVPGAVVAAGGDFNYLQLAFGDLFARFLVSFVFLKAFYGRKVMTPYEFLGQRFGRKTWFSSSAIYIVSRVLASSVRLAACAVGLSVIFGISFGSSVFYVCAVALLYTAFGGIKAVIWTDIFQFVLFIASAVFAAVFIFRSLPGGFGEFLSVGFEAGKFTVFHVSFDSSSPDFVLNFANSKSFLAGSLFGFFTTLAVMGTDQDFVQRTLTCKNLNEGRKALIYSAVLNFPVTLLFLTVGAALFAYYRVFPHDATVTGYLVDNPDYVFPYFIKTVLPPGARGLLIAGLLAAAMSSIDSSANSLASSFYRDFLKNLFTIPEKRSVFLSRILVLVFVLILGVVAIFFGKTQSVLWLGFKVFGYSYGALLGVTLAGIATKKRGIDIASTIAMLSSILVVTFLTSDSVGILEPFRSFVLRPFGVKSVAWTWSIIIGTAWTFLMTIAFRGRVKNK